MMSGVVAGIAVTLAVAISGCSGSDRVAISYPDPQQDFSSLNKKCKEMYEVGLNDIQKSLAFNQCNEERLQFSKVRKINGWVGEITDISTDQGADVVSVTINATIDGFDVAFGTVTNRVSDYATGSMITPKNPLFNVLAQMKEGDLVSFDATFLPHPESNRGIWESSMTEQGSMEEPEFSVRFTGIRPYGADKEPFSSRNASQVAPSDAASLQPSEQTLPGESRDGGSVSELDCNDRIDQNEVSQCVSQEVEAGAVATDPASSNSVTLESDGELASLNGMGYGDGKRLLKEAGYTLDPYVDSSIFALTFDGDPASCGNAGCSMQWVLPRSQQRICVNTHIDERLSESKMLVTVMKGECD